MHAMPAAAHRRRIEAPVPTAQATSTPPSSNALTAQACRCPWFAASDNMKRAVPFYPNPSPHPDLETSLTDP